MDKEQNQLSLENLMIAAPCEVAWDDMVGGETVRRCNDCKLNVYNTKNLTSKEIEELLSTDMAKSGNLCVQLYRRADGTLLTKDCPRGLAKVRAFSSRAGRFVATLIVAILAGGSVMAQDKDKAAADLAKIKHYPAIGGKICPPAGSKATPTSVTTQTTTENHTQQTAQNQNKVQEAAAADSHTGKAHYSALTLYKQGEQLEKSGAFVKAVQLYQEALTAMSKQKHDPKFHLKIETALSRVKAKAGINQ